MKDTFTFTGHGSIYTYIYTDDFNKREPIDDKDCIGMAGLWMIPIMNFDLGKLRDTKIENAVLTLKVENESYPLEVEITSISQQWSSKYATNYSPDKDLAWAGNGWFNDVALSNGNSVYFREETEFDRETGLLRININPVLVYMMINGQSCGLGIVDCKSKGYAVCKEDGWHKEGWLDVKKLNINAEKGFVPQLEIEYTKESYKAPDRAYDFKAAALDNPENTDSVSVLLNWSYNNDMEYDYGFFKLFMAEDTNLPQVMQPVPKYFIPNLDPVGNHAATEIYGLKPNTDYRFALTVANNGCESQTVYTRVKTLGVKPKLQFDDIKAEISGEEAFKLDSSSFSVCFLDELAKVDPVTGIVYDEGGIPADKYACGLYDGEKVSIACVPGEKTGLQLLIYNKIDETRKFTVKSDNTLENNGRIVTNKLWYIKSGDRWYPEVAVDLENNDSFSIPFEENAVAGQRYQSIYIDIELEDSISPGNYTITIELGSGGETVVIPVELEVANISIVRPKFIFELNGYSGTMSEVSSLYDDVDEWEIQKEYYKAGFRHYQSVNIVPYRQNGVVTEGYGPDIEMVDGLPRITDWSKWDAHFGRYLDGSYLHDTYGRNIPIKHLYLPINENWPMPIEEYYTIKVESNEYPQLVNERKLKSTSIEKDFLPGYREGIKAVLKDFIRHIDENGWTGVQFQYFFNNKHFFKDIDKRTGKPGSGSSWWLLDEPVFREDWEALAYYGSILKEVQRELGSGYNVKFRADLSGYNQMFNFLDGILDAAILNNRIFTAREDLARKRKIKFGEEYWVYGSWNPVDHTNMESVLWVIDTYLKGGTGLVPWNNYASDVHYIKPSDIAALYPGKRFGKLHPMVSLRMKAARKGIEMIGLLETFKRAKGYSDTQMKEFTENFLKLQSRSSIRFSFDAGGVEYAANRIKDLERLKSYIIRKLK